MMIVMGATAKVLIKWTRRIKLCEKRFILSGFIFEDRDSDLGRPT